jgi:DNA-binding IscR family transcriptional regulator
VSVAEVIRAVEGPLADVHGAPPEEAVYEGAAVELQRVWIASRVALREVRVTTTLANIASGSLPSSVVKLAARPDGWARR